jgi:hypothetical protein
MGIVASSSFYYKHADARRNSKRHSVSLISIINRATSASVSSLDSSHISTHMSAGSFEHSFDATNVKIWLSFTADKTFPDVINASSAPRSRRASLCQPLPSPTISEDHEDHFDNLGQSTSGAPSTPVISSSRGESSGSRSSRVSFDSYKAKKDGSRPSTSSFLQSSLLSLLDASGINNSGSERSDSEDSDVEHLFSKLSSEDESALSASRVKSTDSKRIFGRKVLKAIRPRIASSSSLTKESKKGERQASANSLDSIIYALRVSSLHLENLSDDPLGMRPS